MVQKWHLLVSLAAVFSFHAAVGRADDSTATRFENALDKTELIFPDPSGPDKPVVKVRRHTLRSRGRGPAIRASEHVWNNVGRVSVPSQALISEPGQAVVLLGTAGDTAAGLGQIEMRSYDGRVLAAIDLREKIPDLEQKSAQWAKASGKPTGTFPWVVAARLLPDESIALIAVCGGLFAQLNLSDHSLVLTKSDANP